MKNLEILNDTNYIHQDPVLKGIYERAVAKFIGEAGERIVFHDLAEYIKSQLIWKKQNLYLHGLNLLSEVCARIGEDFDSGCEYAAPDAKCGRDVHFEVFDL